MGIGRALRRIKNSIVPDEKKYRRIKFGFCKGFSLPLNLRHDFRTTFGFYEMELYKYLKNYTRSRMCCYDVGSSVGYYAFALSRLSSPGKIYSFEANRDQCKMLKEAININKVPSEMIVSNYFVGNLTNPEKNTMTIDDLVFDKGYTPPDLIKMDIEGAEYDAFLGADRVLNEFSPKIIVEVHSEELRDKCKRLLQEKGYDVQIVNQFNFLPKRPGPYNGWLCARKSNGSGKK